MNREKLDKATEYMIIKAVLDMNEKMPVSLKLNTEALADIIQKAIEMFSK